MNTNIKNLEDLKMDLFVASTNGLIEEYKKIMNSNQFDLDTYEHALGNAIFNTQNEIIELMLKDERFDQIDVPEEVSEYYDGSIVKEFLNATTGNRDDFYYDNMVDVFCYDDIENVKLLLACERFDPSFNNNIAIISASMIGRKDIVELLMKDSRVDPSAKDNKPILAALKRNHVKVAKVLLKDPRVKIPIPSKLNTPQVNQNGWCGTCGIINENKFLLKN